eukprot:38195-Chlamydomonas_euryale.AAC.1
MGSVGGRRGKCGREAWEVWEVWEPDPHLIYLVADRKRRKSRNGGKSGRAKNPAPTWSISLLPGKSGNSAMISNMTQPMPQMSIL